MELLTAALGICWRGVRLLYDSLCWVKKMPSPAYCSLGPAWGFPGILVLKREGWKSHCVHSVASGATELFVSASTTNHPVFWQVIRIDLKKKQKKQCIITAEQNSVSSRKCIVLHGMFAQHTPSTQKGLPICLKHNLGQFCSVSPSSLYLLSSCGSASLLLDKRWEEQDKPSTALHYT